MNNKKANGNKEIKYTSYFSKRIGTLAKGCQHCVKGEKLVLFITGVCPRDCWYCPLSDKKMKKDVVYANEWKIDIEKKDFFEDIKTEIDLTDAQGAGITGGDPLSRLSRTVDYIKRLKKEYGKSFHIHLYTSLDLVTEKNLKRLHDAGLDEIRFHPDIREKDMWNRIDIANKFKWDVGVEIPLIPYLDKETKELALFLDKKIKFMNLNELEVTEANAMEFKARGLKTVNEISQATQGSRSLGNSILKLNSKERLSYDVHFCTPKLKDGIQLSRRIMKRAHNVATEFDEITEEGLLIRPVVYGEIKKLKKCLKELKIEYIMDNTEKRAIIDPYKLKEHLNELKKNKLKPAIVEEYPTHDKTKTTVEYL